MKFAIHALLIAYVVFNGVSCQKESPGTCSGYNISYSILPSTDPSAGSFGGEKDITSGITGYKQGKVEANIISVKMTLVVVGLPSGFDFSDFSSLDILLNGEKIASLPSRATGSRINFSLNSAADVKSLIFPSDPPGVVRAHSISFLATTRKAIASNVSIDVQFRLETCE